MLYVATVHHRSTRWIEPQRAYLDRHLDVPFKVYASLEGIPPKYERCFDRVVSSRGGHAGKLNLLARAVCEDAEDAMDLLMFLDGDAFPIANPMPLVYNALDRTPFVAVQRRENLGDRQPHPCFAVTSVGFWQRIRGDWSAGFTWRNDLGEVVSDVGGNLLYILERNGIPWTPIRRTNVTDLHPVNFGVYGDVTYHHGTGFRTSPTRLDTASLTLKDRSIKALITLLGTQRAPRLARFATVVLPTSLRNRIRRQRLEPRRTAVDNAVYQELLHDPGFWRKFVRSSANERRQRR